MTEKTQDLLDWITQVSNKHGFGSCAPADQEVLKDIQGLFAQATAPGRYGAYVDALSSLQEIIAKLESAAGAALEGAGAAEEGPSPEPPRSRLRSARVARTSRRM